MIDLQQQIENLKRDLLDRYALEDWHGVRDALLKMLALHDAEIERIADEIESQPGYV